MDPPTYGTEPPESIPVLSFSEGVTARLLAGMFNDAKGPFQTKQDVQIIDFMLEPNTTTDHTLSPIHDNCLVYVYRGGGELCDTAIRQHQVAQLEFSGAERTLTLRAGESGMSVLLFAGKRINEPVSWRGPFVLNTFEEIQNTMLEYRNGDFPPNQQQEL
jgi:hypothetical protein